MIRYDQTGQWPSSRRCGHAVWASTAWHPCIEYGTYDGNSTHDGSLPYKPYDVCPSNRWGPKPFKGEDMHNTYEEAIACCCCAVYNRPDVFCSSAAQDWAKRTTCPKGWGKNFGLYRDDPCSVHSGQGYVKSGKLPVYGYVTRYNTKYYNYITARVSKA